MQSFDASKHEFAKAVLESTITIFPDITQMHSEQVSAGSHTSAFVVYCNLGAAKSCTVAVMSASKAKAFAHTKLN